MKKEEQTQVFPETEREAKSSRFPRFALIFYAITAVSAILYVIFLCSERLSDGFNRYVASVIRGFLAYLTNWIPFSLAEFMLILLPVWIVGLTVFGIRRYADSWRGVGIYCGSVLSVAAVPGVWLMLFTRERRALKALFAFVVTVCIIAAVGAFFRVLLKSTVASLICSLCVYVMFLFSGTFGLFSPFGSMAIANLQEFYINRFVWIFLCALLIGISVSILKMRDHFQKIRF